MSPPRRLAIVCSHPVQYYAPWFRHLAATLPGPVRVFYLWDPGAQPERPDPEFGRSVRWDTDLRFGYDHEFVPNLSTRPGTDHFRGLSNPGLPSRLRAFAPDAVLLFGYGWEANLRLALSWRECPLILRGDSHDIARGGAGSPLPPLRQTLRALAPRLLFPRFAAFAAVGAATRRHYLDRGVPAARIHQVPHCVDNAFFAGSDQAGSRPWRERLALPEGEKLVLFLGKFVPKKRPDLLLRAFLRLAAPDSTLLLVGDGPLETELRALAPSHARVVFIPFQNQTEIPPLLASADLLVLPSQGPGETWGLVVNEAMAAGLPALVSDHVGCREDLIDEGKTGWSFPAGDEAALVAALGRALDALRQPGAGARFREAVRTKVDAYSYPAATRALQGLLDALPRRRTSSRP